MVVPNFCFFVSLIYEKERVVWKEKRILSREIKSKEEEQEEEEQEEQKEEEEEKEKKCVFFYFSFQLILVQNLGKLFFEAKFDVKLGTNFINANPTKATKILNR